MNEEKKTSQMKNSAGEYTAPKIKVKELRHRSVICASQLGSMGFGSDQDDNAFN